MSVRFLFNYKKLEYSTAVNISSGIRIASPPIVVIIQTVLATKIAHIKSFYFSCITVNILIVTITCYIIKSVLLF